MSKKASFCFFFVLGLVGGAPVALHKQTDRDMETQKHRYTESRRNRDTETQRHRDTETQRHRHRDTETETRRINKCICIYMYIYTCTHASPRAYLYMARHVYMYIVNRVKQWEAVDKGAISGLCRKRQVSVFFRFRVSRCCTCSITRADRQRHWDTDALTHRDTETQRHRDTETQRHRHVE